jgi:hypothetical protein
MERQVFPSIDIDACNTIAKKGICTCTHAWHEEAEELHFYVFICFEVILKKMHLTLNRIYNIIELFSFEM